jgi:hypothetical protein
MSRRTLQYILRGHEPIPCNNVLEWVAFMECDELRRVAFDTVNLEYRTEFRAERSKKLSEG